MRSLSLLLVLVQLLFAIQKGRPMGSAPGEYFTLNGSAIPHKIVHLGTKKDLTYDTLSVEMIKFSDEKIGLINRLTYDASSPSDYWFYYDSLGRIDLIDVKVIDNGEDQAYSYTSYEYTMRVDSLFLPNETIVDSVLVTSCEFKVAMIPGYPLRKYRKQESYIRVGDSTDNSLTRTTDYYNFIPATQGGGGHYLHMYTGKVIEVADTIFDILADAGGGDTLFIKTVLNESGDTLQSDATRLSESNGRYDLYRSRFTYSDTLHRKVVEVFDTTSSSWRDSVHYDATLRDGAFTLIESHYDSLTLAVIPMVKEVHMTTLNPRIVYYRKDSVDNELKQYAEDHLIFDTTIVSLIHTGIFTSNGMSVVWSAEGLSISGATTKVSAELYTLSGRRIKSMAPIVAGETFLFPTSGIASGVYLFSVRSAEKCVRQVICIK